METRAHHLFVGLFTVIALVAAVFFTLWLTKAGSERAVVEYEVVFTDGVSGLSVGSPVQFNGIRIGEVANLQLDPNDPNQVRLRILVDNQVRIAPNTSARLALLNVTGATAIDLYVNDKSVQEHMYNSRGIAVLVAEPSPFTRLRVSSEELLVNLNSFLNNAANIVSDENSERIASILTNLDQLSGSLAQQSDSLGADLSALMANLNTTSEQLTQTLQRFDENILSPSEPIMANAAEAMQSLADMSQRIETLVAQHEGSVASGLDGVAEIGPVIRELRNTIHTVNMILLQIDQDPAGYLLGREQLKEYKP